MPEGAPREKSEAVERTALIEKSDGIFYIRYSKSHSEQESVNGLEGVDGIALESLHGSIDLRYNDPAFKGAVSDLFEGDKQYGDLFRHAREHGKDIYAVDAKTQETFIISVLQKTLRGLEGVAAAALLAKLAHDTLTQNKVMDRRAFLKLGAKSIVGAYLSLPTIQGLTGLWNNGSVDKDSASVKVEYFLNDLNEKMHPETQAIIQTFRNYLMAQKLETIARNASSNSNKNPRIGLVIGAAHRGIEGVLRESDKERIQVLRKFLTLPGIEKEKKELATIARFHYSDSDQMWKVDYFEDPLLKSLE